MRTAERWLNALAGVSVLSWAVLGLAAAGSDTRWTALRLTVLLLNACVGTLLLVRSPLINEGSAASIAAAAPSLLIAGLALRQAPAANHWPFQANAAVVAGGALAVYAFLSLGKSFALFPALRHVVRGGPYRVVRHPAYVGELLMVSACCLAKGQPTYLAWWPFVVAVPAAMVRIIVEERVLAHSAEYRVYAETVRWRLLPGVW